MVWTPNEIDWCSIFENKYEGIIPAIESSHALAYAIKYAKEKKSGSILVCLSGRGDKDIDYVYEKYGCGEQFNIDRK